MVGMPRVGKISRGIWRTATSEPSANAATSTRIVNGRRRATRTRFIGRASPFGSFPARFSDLGVEFPHLCPQHGEDPMPGRCQTVVLTGPLPAARLNLTLKPSQPGHPLEQRIKRAGTDIVTVPA